MAKADSLWWNWELGVCEKHYLPEVPCPDCLSEPLDEDVEWLLTPIEREGWVPVDVPDAVRKQLEERLMVLAREEINAHALFVISTDDISNMGTSHLMPMYCRCPECKPSQYPENIYDLLERE